MEEDFLALFERLVIALEKIAQAAQDVNPNEEDD